MTQFMWINFKLCLCVDFLLLDSLVHAPAWNLKVHQRHEFVICTSSEGGNERWQLMSKLAQFTGVHFPELNPNSYDNLNNIKLDLNVFLPKVKFSANDQSL